MSAAITSTPTAPTPAAPPARWVTVADLLHDLGDIPAERVRFYPHPGTATEADATAARGQAYLCELVAGTLVEKPMGAPESFLGGLVLSFLNIFVVPRQLGAVMMPDAQFRMQHGNLRLPDVSFTRLARLPNPLPQIGGWSPDLCVEVLSPDNTAAEMAQKRLEYFASGTRLVWEIDPRGRTVDVYTAPDVVTPLGESDVLDGGLVLPGFTLPLGDLFAAYDVVNRNPRPTP